MQIIALEKWVVHKDGRQGQVIDIKEQDGRARVKWVIDPFGRPYSTDKETIMSNKVKRTWVKFADITLLANQPSKL